LNVTSFVYRGTTFVFSIVCYGVFLGVFLYLLAFLGNVWVPWSIDLGRDMGSMGIAVAVDVGLILLFGLQHSVMARPGFKRAWTRVVPKELERSAYVLLSSAVLALVMWQWRPIPTPVIWVADATWSIALGWAVMAAGVAILLLATFLINHFELFGLQQGWLTLRGQALRTPAFVTPLLYKIVRHPLYVGWFLIFWGAPTLSAGHFLFSAGMSAYILIAIRFEERDLVEHIGEPYRRYREQVPALIPVPGRRLSG
jgi:protein-S-isoprenylcysteine O-methyltransferase Ste14